MLRLLNKSTFRVVAPQHFARSFDVLGLGSISWPSIHTLAWCCTMALEKPTFGTALMAKVGQVLCEKVSILRTMCDLRGYWSLERSVGVLGRDGSKEKDFSHALFNELAIFSCRFGDVGGWDACLVRCFFRIALSPKAW